MADKLNYTKTYKDLYQPGKKPVLVQVPAISFLYTDGTGAPEGPVYQNGVAALYSVANTIKFSHKKGGAPAGYFEFIVPPLEGLWANVPTLQPGDRETWRFTSLIRQPEFVTPAVFQRAVEQASQKKPDIDFSVLRLGAWEEGLCVQAMHTGPFATEPETLAQMDAWMAEHDLVPDFSDEMAGLYRRHHEIYLSNPRKTAPETRKTVLRLPVRPTK